MFYILGIFVFLMMSMPSSMSSASTSIEDILEKRSTACNSKETLNHSCDTKIDIQATSTSVTSTTMTVMSMTMLR